MLAASATVPERISGRANDAFSEAKIRSQDKAISNPPPQQIPLPEQIKGLFKYTSS